MKCPGAERLWASSPDEIPCVCGEKVEMWPDDSEVRCPRCGRTVSRELPPACVAWCAAARDCVGEKLYLKYMKVKAGGRPESKKSKVNH